MDAVNYEISRISTLPKIIAIWLLFKLSMIRKDGGETFDFDLVHCLKKIFMSKYKNVSLTGKVSASFICTVKPAKAELQWTVEKNK